MGDDRRVLRGQGEAGRQVVEVDLLAGQPLRVGVLGGQGGLDLLVGDDAALGGVDQEHAARLQPAPLHDPGRVDVEDADLGGHDDQAVVGDPVAGGAQSVAVEDGADDGPVGEGDRRRAVPRLHEGGVELVEGPLGRRPCAGAAPRPRGSSSARRGAGERPPRCSSSSTSSKLAESLAPGVMIGKIRSRSPGKRSLASRSSRARIQLRLPCRVLISPLWAR